MQLPSLGSSPDTYIRLGVAHAAALESDPATAGLAAPVTAAVERVRRAWADQLRGREASVVKLALRIRVDAEADRLLHEVEAETLAAAGRDRTKSPYIDLFPKGLTPIVAAPLAEEIEAMVALEPRLAAIPVLRRFAASVGEIRERLSAAAAAYADAVRAETDASNALTLAKRDLGNTLRASAAALETLLGDRRRADTYFVHIFAPIDDADAAPAPQRVG